MKKALDFHFFSVFSCLFFVLDGRRGEEVEMEEEEEEEVN